MGGCCSCCYTPKRIPIDEAERQFILPIKHANRNVIICHPTEDRNAAIDVGKRSFCGSETSPPEGAMDWALGPRYRGKWNDEMRLAFFEFMLTWTFITGVKYGVNFGFKDPDSSKLLALCVTRPPGSIKNGRAETAAIMTGVSKEMGFQAPPWEKNKAAYAGVSKRVDVLGKIMTENHKVYACDDHWYVYVMAVAPEGQGMGCCSGILRHINALADAEDVPCYLETVGEKNIAIYSHLGYEVVNVNEVPADPALYPGGEEPEALEFAIMVRPRASQRTEGSRSSRSDDSS